MHLKLFDAGNAVMQSRAMQSRAMHRRVKCNGEKKGKMLAARR